MFRKLHTRSNAVLLASLVGTCGLLMATSSPLDAASPARRAYASAPSAPALTNASGAVRLVAPRKARKARRARPSAGMPYFSFVPRG